MVFFIYLNNCANKKLQLVNTPAAYLADTHDMMSCVCTVYAILLFLDVILSKKFVRGWRISNFESCKSSTFTKVTNWKKKNDVPIQYFMGLISSNFGWSDKQFLKSSQNSWRRSAGFKSTADKKKMKSVAFLPGYLVSHIPSLQDLEYSLPWKMERLSCKDCIGCIWSLNH